MEKSLVKKRGLAAIFALCPTAHVIALLGAGVVALFFALRHDTEKMRFLSLQLVQPLHRVLARLTARLPFSLAEWLYAAAIGGTLLYIAAELVLLVRRPARLRRLYRLFMRLAALGLGVYALFCVLWGVYYYGDDFIARSGLELHDISAEELELTTLYFADLLNEYAPRVPRDENGLCRTDRQAVLERSPGIFRAAAQRFPCLTGPEVPAKGMFFSRVMSIIDYTGFFCPFTAEANVNMDFPEALFAAVVAHELSHQRGVAKEQEANFVAVLASLESGDPDYCYSACMMAYAHLGNALAGVDPHAQWMIYNGLDEGVKADLLANNAYWAQFDTPIQTVTNTVYEGFLQSYGQTLGMRSYGACVDLLVNYYGETAAAHFAVGETPEAAHGGE
jgi:hypothetical protein